MSIEGGIQWRAAPRWLLSVSLGALFSPRASSLMIPEMSPVPVDVGTFLGAGVLAPCAHLNLGFGSLFGCAALELGGIRANSDGTDVRPPIAATGFWGAVDPRLGLEIPMPYVPRLAFRVFGDVPILLSRPTAVVEVISPMGAVKPIQVWRGSPVAGGGNAGFVVFL